MMSLGGDPGSGDSDSNGDGGGGIDDDPLASFSLSALGALGALGVGRGASGGGGGSSGGGGAGARAERSILNDFLGQFIQAGNATTVRIIEGFPQRRSRAKRDGVGGYGGQGGERRRGEIFLR